jgi:hypothetical protein
MSQRPLIRTDQSRFHWKTINDHYNYLGLGLAEGTGDDGDGHGLPRGGVREAAGLRYGGDERGGRKEERKRSSWSSPLPSAAAELSRESIRGSLEDEEVRSFPGNFGPYRVGNEPSLGWNSGGLPGNSGQIPALISMPLQTREFESKFLNS